MCRSIKQLRGLDPLSDDEIRAAALQYVRKVSGYRKPSQINQAAVDQAVEQIAGATRDLLGQLVIGYQGRQAGNPSQDAIKQS